MADPDRYRFARFALEAVQALEGDVFAAAGALTGIMQALREDCLRAAAPLGVDLQLDGGELYGVWPGRRAGIVTFRDPPAAQTVTELAQRLRQASESADPELLKRRNRQISAELAQIEAQLEKKKAELQESLRLAEMDGLTGLYNRGAYDGRLQEAVLRCARQQEPLSLILLDLDNFQQINDSRGHQYGDEYLKRMAQAMRDAVRQHVDIPCRMGGDEFAIIVFSEREIARRIADAVLGAMDGRVSIGIAERRADDTINSLVGRADMALYGAKRGGRGRVAEADQASLPGDVVILPGSP
ncbi:MAG: diguanylate cyclase [Gammaproteobacteria bacterium]|nr:diguanylate cyclase [Gammaproteobacteria bacterium]